jgi:hypothetical protein
MSLFLAADFIEGLSERHSQPCSGAFSTAFKKKIERFYFVGRGLPFPAVVPSNEQPNRHPPPSERMAKARRLAPRR